MVLEKKVYQKKGEAAETEKSPPTTGDHQNEKDKSPTPPPQQTVKDQPKRDQKKEFSKCL